MDYTDDITTLYIDEQIDEMEDIINEIADIKLKNILTNKLDRIRDELKIMYDKAYNIADAMDMIQDAIDKLN